MREAELKNTEIVKEGGLADMADMAERDHEVQMARAELYKIAKYAIKLHEMLKGVSETKLDEALEFDLREAEEGEIFGIGVDGSEHLTLEFLRKYIAYAKRNVNPDLSDDAKALILEYYTNERQSFGRDQQQYSETEVIPITPRDLGLTAREYALLLVMIKRPGHVFSREQLLREVWNDQRSNSNVVEVYVRYLRQKLEGEGQSRVLLTVRGKGYSLGPVAAEA